MVLHEDVRNQQQINNESQETSMTELWIIGIIAFLGLILTVISSKDNVTDNQIKWYKRLTNRGLKVLILGISIVILSLLQAIIVNKKENQKEITQINQRKISDSIISAEIKKGVDLSRQQLFYDLSEAFAKQNLKLDTVNKSIQTLRDSAKTVIINSPHDDPIIIVREDGITHIQKNDTIEFKLSIVSTQAACNLIFINYFCEVNFVDGSKSNSFLSKQLLKGILLIPKEQPLSTTFEIYIHTKKKIDFVNIALIGKYRQTESNKEILLQSVCKYSFITKKTSFLFPDEIKNFFGKYFIR